MMAKRPATNKLWEPFSNANPGICPNCGQPTMTILERDTIFYLLDEDGIPTDPICDTQKKFTCMKCGFVTDKYVCTDRGYRYSPFGFDDYIKYLNRIPRSYTRVDVNPLVKEEKK